jgi:hypothetical protein
LDNNPEPGFTHSIQGQVLRLSDRRMAAIFLHDGVLWVADFIDSHGELVDAITWFRFNCGSISAGQARRRMVLESATPLSEELVNRIDRLRRPAPAQPGLITVRLVEAIAAYLSHIRSATMAACRIGQLRTRSTKHALPGSTAHSIRKSGKRGI